MSEKPAVEFSHRELAMMIALLNTLDPEGFEGEAKNLIQRCRGMSVALRHRAFVGMEHNGHERVAVPIEDDDTVTITMNGEPLLGLHRGEGTIILGWWPEGEEWQMLQEITL